MSFACNITVDGNKIKNTYDKYVKVVVLSYEINTYPRAMISLCTSDTDYLDYKEMEVELTTDDYKHKFFLAIDDIYLKDSNEVVIQGYMAKREQVNKVDSSYLGNSPDKAISTLGFTQDLNYGKQFGVNVTQKDYFRINDTAINSLLKILTGNGYQSVFSITENRIRVHNIYDIPTIKPDKGNMIETALTDLQMDNLFSLDDSPSVGEYSIKSVSDGKSTPYFKVSSQYGFNLISPKDNDFEYNAVSNSVYLNGLGIKLTASENKDTSIELGDYVSIRDPAYKPNVFLVTKVQKTYEENAFSSSYELQTIRRDDQK